MSYIECNVRNSVSLYFSNSLQVSNFISSSTRLIHSIEDKHSYKGNGECKLLTCKLMSKNKLTNYIMLLHDIEVRIIIAV